MSAIIPPSGEDSFAIEPQNLALLDRLLRTGAAEPALELSIGADRVVFVNARVLDLLCLPSVNGVELISVRLDYASRSLGQSSSGGAGASRGNPFLAPVGDGSLFAKLQSDAKQRQAERFETMQKLQTKIFEVTQGITVNKAKTADRAFTQMSGYIRQ